MRWILAAAVAAVSAYACAVAVQRPTPVDAAIPLIAIVVTLIAALSHVSIQAAVPLLIGGAIVIADERTRLIWSGVVIGAAFAAALLVLDRRGSLVSAPIVAVSAILILRWIPLQEVLFGREIFVLLIAVGIVVVFHATPMAIAIAVATSLLTPAVPLRTFSIPLTVLMIGMILRVAGMRRRDSAVLPAAAVAFMLLFFPWSGIVARALPLTWRGLPRPAEREPLRMALAAGESVELGVPDGARSLIVSGANVPRLKRGRVIGRLDPGGKLIRIGDVADWGSFRRDQWYGSRNPLPRHVGGELRGYGHTAWVDGAGRLELPGTRRIRVTAAPDLADDARLQIDAFELEQR